MEIRKEAVKQAEKQEDTFAECLKKAYNSTEIKIKYFTDPIQFKLKKRKAETTPTDDSGLRQPKHPKTQKNNGNNGNNKGGKGKGKGKGKGGKGKGSCKARTPDGKEICFAFNRKGAWCPGNCGREHVCGVCFRPNKPMHNCNHSSGPPPSG